MQYGAEVGSRVCGAGLGCGCSSGVVGRGCSACSACNACNGEVRCRGVGCAVLCMAECSMWVAEVALCQELLASREHQIDLLNKDLAASGCFTDAATSVSPPQ